MDTVTISVSDYIDLLNNSDLLQALLDWDVETWSYFSYAKRDHKIIRSITTLPDGTRITTYED